MSTRYTNGQVVVPLLPSPMTVQFRVREMGLLHEELGGDFMAAYAAGRTSGLAFIAKALYCGSVILAKQKNDVVLKNDIWARLQAHHDAGGSFNEVTDCLNKAIITLYQPDYLPTYEAYERKLKEIHEEAENAAPSGGTAGPDPLEPSPEGGN